MTRRSALLAGACLAGTALSGCTDTGGTAPTVRGSASTPSTPAVPISTYTDMRYAETIGRAHLLDLHVPLKAAGPHPVVVLVNGSAFRSDDTKGGTAALPAEMAGGDPDVTGPGGGHTTAALLAQRWGPLGYAVAGVNVRTSAQGHFPDQIHDVKAALRFLRAHAADFNLDISRFATMGNSSGGWVATMAAVTSNLPEFEGELGNADQSSAVQACIDLFGPTDLLALGPGHDGADSPESQLMGFPLQSRPRITERADPCRYVTAASPPIFISHGLEDPLVGHEQSELLFAAYQSVGAAATLILVPGAGHGDGYLDDAGLSRGRSVRVTRHGRTTRGTSPAPTYDALLSFLDDALG